MAIGAEDPLTGDFFVSTLDSRTMRLDWRTIKKDSAPQSAWERDYSAPLPFQAGNTLPVSLEHHEWGFITQAVVGAPFSLDVKRQVLWLADQDGHLYALDVKKGDTESNCTSAYCDGRTGRPHDGAAPPLLSRTGVGRNNEPETPYTRHDEGGPWDYNQMALGGLVMGGDVLYVPSWDNSMTAFDVRDPRQPRKVWRYEVTTDQTFPYPPFGETFAKNYNKDTLGKPFSDLDNKIFSGPALLGGHLYFAASDGSVYAFNLHHKVKTVRNLVVLGSGTVPFLPQWKDALGAFDNVWTPADWYKNQVAPAGYRLPKAAGVASLSTFLLLSAAAWWWIRRRDEEGAGG